MIGDVTSAGAERSKHLQRKDPPQGQTRTKPAAENPADTVRLNGKPDEPLTYANPALEQGISAKFLMLREIVSRMFRDQGIATVVDAGGGTKVDIAAMTPDEAEALVADDGYWGVDKTSDRIVAFATGVAGNDPAKLEEIKEGVRRGFKLAGKDFGMALPEISRQTFDATMEKLDRWAEESAKAAPPTSASAADP